MATIGRSCKLGAVLLLVLGAALGLTTACRRGASPATDGPPSRHLLAEARGLALSVDAFASRATGHLDLIGRKPLSTWEVGAPARLQVVDGCLTIVDSKRQGAVLISRKLGLDASQVSSVVASLGSERSGDTPSLLWAPSDERLSRARSVDGRIVPRRSGSVLFDVGSETGWTGGIGRIGVRLSETARLCGLSATLARPESQQGRTVRLDVDHEVREVVTLDPRSPFERRIDDSGWTRLELGLALLNEPSSPFEISIEQLRTGRSPITLWRRNWPPHPPDQQRQRWIDVTVDVAAPASPWSLRIACSSSSSGDTAPLLALADPILRRPTLTRSAPRPNIVLVSLDTLRADRLSLYGYTKATSPNLDAWARRNAIMFRNALAAAPRTLPSHATMLSGLDPISHGVNHIAPAPDRLELISERLRHSGYQTYAVTGGGIMGPRFGFPQGFDRYRYASTWPGHSGELETNAGHALAMLRQRDTASPFFLFLHTYEIHDPFEPDPEDALGCASAAPAAAALREATPSHPRMLYGARPVPRRSFDGFALTYRFIRWLKSEPIKKARPADTDETDLISCLYDSGIRSADAALGAFLEELEALGGSSHDGLHRDTLIIITSDHGESLGEQGRAKHAYLTAENLYVPLIVALPGRARAGTWIEDHVGLVDLVPTMLELIGVRPGNEPDGVSLVPIIEGGTLPRHRLLWSYAAHENRGLAVLLDEHSRALINNTAWSAVQGSASVEEVTTLGFSPSERGADEQASLLRLAHQELATALGQRWSGTVISFGGSGFDRVTGTIAAARDLEPIVKTSGTLDGTVTRSTKNQLALDLRSSPHARLLLEEVSGHLDIRCRFFRHDAALPATELRKELELGEISGCLELVYDGSEWRTTSGTRAGTAAATVSVCRVAGPGTRAMDGEAATGEDTEAMNQLRALGYIQ